MGCPFPTFATGDSGCWGLATACLWAARSAEEGRWEKPCPLAGAHSNATTSPHSIEAMMRAGRGNLQVLRGTHQHQLMI